MCGLTRYGGIATFKNGVREMYLADWLCAGSGVKTAADAIVRKHRLSAKEKLKFPTMESGRVTIDYLEKISSYS